MSRNVSCQYFLLLLDRLRCKSHQCTHTTAPASPGRPFDRLTLATPTSASQTLTGPSYCHSCCQSNPLTARSRAARSDTAPAVRVINHAGTQTKRIQHQLGIITASEVPTDGPSRTGIRHHRQIAKACTHADVSRVRHLQLIEPLARKLAGQRQQQHPPLPHRLTKHLYELFQITILQHLSHLRFLYIL